MGKAATTTGAIVEEKTVQMKRKKKKGRPSLSDLQKRRNSNSTPRRSTRRNPNSGDFIDGYDSDERKEKKVKLVVRLPQSKNSSSEANSLSNSDGEDELEEEEEVSVKRRKIDGGDCRSDDQGGNEKLIMKGTDTSNGSPLVSGPTTPLPDKKLLVFILDRLQKKDTYGVFSEPVDPDELPDYHEMIEYPMDFGTVRKKLDGGLYSNVEQLEADVFLICSNAMQYNGPDTVYFRQARSIQDLAKRDFENLRHAGEDGEPQPKVVRRGRPPSKNLKKSEESSPPPSKNLKKTEESSPPPSKNLKKSVESSPIDFISPELSSGVTPASGEEKANGSKSYNLRKGPMLYKFRSVDTSSAYRSRNGETYSEWLVDWNHEFPASILRADMKYGKKHFSVDENRRDTYQLLPTTASCSDPSLLWSADGDVKRLMAVGVHFEQHAYARSLARFSANLGPVVWKIASKRLETVLPAGVKFGPGWVGEGGGSTQLSTFPSQNKSSDSDHHTARAVTPSLPELSSVVKCRPTDEKNEAANSLNSQNEQAQGSGGFSCASPPSTSQAQQKPFLNPRNGFNGMFGYDLSGRAELARLSMPKGQLGLQEASRPGQVIGTVPGSDTSSSHHAPSNHVSSLDNSLRESWTTLHSGKLAPVKDSDFCREQNARLSADSLPTSVSSGQYRQSLPIPPDLNVRAQTSGSPSSSLQVGSPQQPDLALQL